MTVSNQTNRTSATGTGSTGQEIPFKFPIKATSEVTVTKRLISTGDPTTLVETTNYTVVIDGDNGGTVTTVTTIETTEQIHLVGNAPYTQLLDLEQGGDFNAENLEDGFDRTTRLTTQNKDLLDNKVILFPTTDPSLTTELPNSVDRASKVVSFDTNGNVTATDAVPEGSVSFSAYGKTIVAAASALTVKPILNLDHVFDVRDYGADPTGASDSTAAFQSAIDAAEAAGALGGGTVLAPAGTYIFATELDITDGIVTLTGPTPYGTDVTLTYSGTGTFITLNTDLCVVQNLRIVGPDSAAGVGDIGILVASGNSENRVRFCYVEDWDIGIKVAGSQTTTEDVHVQDSATTAIEINSGVNNKIINCFMNSEATANSVLATNAGRHLHVLHSVLTNCVDGIKIVSSSGQVVARDCHFESCTGEEITTVDASSSILITGNRMEGHIKAASGTEMTLINNIFTGTRNFKDNAGSDWIMMGNQNAVGSDFSVGSGTIVWLDKGAKGVQAFTAADETPDVSNGDIYSTNNASAGNITDFDKPWTGKIITLIGNDAGLTTIIHGSGVRIKDQRNFTLLDGDALSLMYDGTDWFEVGRSHNTSNSTALIVCNENQVVCNENTVVIN